MTVLAVLFETHCRFQKQRRKKKRFFPEVLLKVFGLFFLFPRWSSVEKGTAIFLRFSQGHEGAEREGAEEPPAESWASGEVSVSTVLVLPGRALGPGGQGRRRDTRSFPAEARGRGSSLWQQVLLSFCVLGTCGTPGKAKLPRATGAVWCRPCFPLPQ